MRYHRWTRVVTGCLALGSSALAMTPAAAQRPARVTATVVFTVPLTRSGTTQRGTAALTVNAASNQVCYRLTTAHLAPVLAAHIG